MCGLARGCWDKAPDRQQDLKASAKPAHAHLPGVLSLAAAEGTCIAERGQRPEASIPVWASASPCETVHSPLCLPRLQEAESSPFSF